MLDRTRLEKHCEGLSSPSPAARAVAAAKITGMLQGLDLTWPEILAGATTPSARREATGSLHGLNADSILAAVAEHIKAMHPGDREFVRTLQRAPRPRALSRFQWAILMRLAIQTGSLMDAAQ